MDRLSKNPQISNFIKIRPLRTELFGPDEHYEANSCFLQFLERSLKKETPNEMHEGLSCECNVIPVTRGAGFS